MAMELWEVCSGTHTGPWRAGTPTFAAGVGGAAKDTVVSRAAWKIEADF